MALPTEKIVEFYTAQIESLNIKLLRGKSELAIIEDTFAKFGEEYMKKSQIEAAREAQTADEKHLSVAVESLERQLAEAVTEV